MRTRRKRYSAEFKREALRRSSEFEWPELADFRLAQCNMTALDCGWGIGRHENRSSTLTENRSSQVHGDSHISSGREFGMSKEQRKANFDPSYCFRT